VQFAEVLVDVIDDNKWLHGLTQPHPSEGVKRPWNS
jgi:hypothetical protein